MMKLRDIAKSLYFPRGSEPGPAPADKSLLGLHAERLLADPVLHLAFDRVRDKLNLTWAASTPGDGEGRERCYMQLQGLERVKGELLAILGDKKMIEAEAKAKDKRDERERERRAAV
jgi:hypothetical protein